MLLNLLAATGPDLDNAVSPIYTVVSSILPIALSVVFVIAMIHCIGLGMAYAKSDENGTHEKAKKDLINAIVGYVLIFVLIGVLYLAKDPLIQWLENLTDWNFNTSN